jgi:hypothetical protein
MAAGPALKAELFSVEWQPVSSSNVAAVGYVPDFARLHVRFHNGSSYVYLDVPESIYNGLLGAASVGRYLHLMVKNRFGFIRTS